jgi:hypothetical protein
MHINSNLEGGKSQTHRAHKIDVEIVRAGRPYDGKTVEVSSSLNSRDKVTRAAGRNHSNSFNIRKVFEADG